MRTSLVHVLVVACTVAAMAGCRSSGSYWPNLAWWNARQQNADAPVVADAKSSGLPQLPSAGATPTANSAIAGSTSPTATSPASATINAGGTLPTTSGAVPASYPTTPYPAIPPIQALGQTSSQEPPDRTSGGAYSPDQTVSAPVQTKPYTSDVPPQRSMGSQIVPQDVSHDASTAPSRPPYDGSVPAYRTADTRSTSPNLTNATATPESSAYPGSGVGDRYASPTTRPPVYDQPFAATAPQNRTQQSPGDAAAPAQLGQDTAGREANRSDRYPGAELPRYGMPPAGQEAPESRPAQMPDTAAGSPMGTPPASDSNWTAPPVAQPYRPAATSVSPPSDAARPIAPAEKPSAFRPGGTSNYAGPVGATSPATATGGGLAVPFSPPSLGSSSAAAGNSPSAPPYADRSAIGYPQISPPAGYPTTATQTAPPVGGTPAVGRPVAPPAGYPSQTAPYNPAAPVGSGAWN